MTSMGRTMQLNGLSIYYEIHGDGKHIVFMMPGVLGTVEIDFKHQLKAFDQSIFTLVCWETPGYGRSRPPERDYNNCYVRDSELAVTFMKNLGFDNFSVLAFSDSGRTAILMSARYPQVVNKLVIWGTCVFICPEIRRILPMFRDTSVWSRERLRMYESVYGDDVEAIWCGWIDYILTLEDITQYLKQIKCPTLILHGQKDEIVPLQPHAHHLKNHIYGSRLVVFPKAPHICHQSNASEFNVYVKRFLLK